MALVVKNTPTNTGNLRDAGLIPGLGRSLRQGNGNPLQYSCLENPMDRGAWWATVPGVTKSGTWLRWLRTDSSLDHEESSEKGISDQSHTSRLQVKNLLQLTIYSTKVLRVGCKIKLPRNFENPSVQTTAQTDEIRMFGVWGSGINWKALLKSRVAQAFWHQGPVLWKTIFLRTWGLGMVRDDSSTLQLLCTLFLLLLYRLYLRSSGVRS